MSEWYETFFKIITFFPILIGLGAVFSIETDTTITQFIFIFNSGILNITFGFVMYLLWGYTE